MQLSVIIVSYNVEPYIVQCLKSLYKALLNMEADIWVVDNHSKDSTCHKLQHLFPHVHLLKSKHNLGFSKANNLAIRQCRGKYILLINPDTVVGEDVLNQAVSFMDAHGDCGELGVRMINPDGSVAMESRRGVPTPMTAFYKMSGLCKRFPTSKRFAHYYMSYLPWDKPVEIEVVSGAFALLRREALDKVGLLDEDFFMYGEDIDLSYRILKGGFKNYYLPLTILHYKGESTRKSSFRYVHVFYQAMLIFFEKHYHHLSFFVSFPIKVAVYGKATLTLLSILSNHIYKSLGFVRRSYQDIVHYVFTGSEKSAQTCKALALQNGIIVELHISKSASELPDTHFNVPNTSLAVVVFDMAFYTYENVLQYMSRHYNEHIEVGFYYPESRTIITSKEVIR